jgi:hypothetical protein
MEIVNNESINTEYKTKTATEETAGTTRTRDIEKINQQQQFVNSRLEEAGRKQQQFRKSIDTTEEDLEYVEDLYTQLFLLLEDTYERFQHIQGRMNTDKNSKKTKNRRRKTQNQKSGKLQQKTI